MSDWPGGISDGLTLPCAGCGIVPKFDFTVEDDFWRRVVPSTWRLGVVCLPCLDLLADAIGEDVGRALRAVQFTGIGKTVLLGPAYTFYYVVNTRASVPPPNSWNWSDLAREAPEAAIEIEEVGPITDRRGNRIAAAIGRVMAQREHKLFTTLATRLGWVGQHKAYTDLESAVAHFQEYREVMHGELMVRDARIKELEAHLMTLKNEAHPLEDLAMEAMNKAETQPE